MTGSSSPSNKHVVSSQRFRGAAGCGCGADALSRVPVDIKLACGGEAAVTHRYRRNGLCGSRGLLPALPPSRCAGLGAGVAGLSLRAPRPIPPRSARLLAPRLPAETVLVVSEGVR